MASEPVTEALVAEPSVAEPAVSADVASEETNGAEVTEVKDNSVASDALKENTLVAPKEDDIIPSTEAPTENGSRRGNFSRPRKDYAKNVISDPMTLGKSDDPAEIRKQVGYLITYTSKN
jgi:hypothetical protein